MKNEAIEKAKPDAGPWTFYHAACDNAVFLIPNRRPRVFIDPSTATARTVRHEELHPEENHLIQFTPVTLDAHDGRGSGGGGIFRTHDKGAADYLRSLIPGSGGKIQEIPDGADLREVAQPKHPPAKRMLQHQVPTMTGGRW